MADLEQLTQQLSKLTLMDASKLVKKLEETWGVSASVPMATAAPAAAGEVEEEEEKDAFDVVLSSFGSKKINVIKEVRSITTLGLKEAKDLVEAAPKVVKEGVKKEEAQKIKKQLEAVGATVEIK